MAGAAITGHSKMNWRRMLRRTIGGIAPWLLSCVLHGAGIIGLGLLSGTAAPQTGDQFRSVDLVLSAEFAISAGDSHSEAAFPVSLVSHAADAPLHESLAPPLLAQLAPPLDRGPPAALPSPLPAQSLTAREATRADPPLDRSPRLGVQTQLFGISGRGNRFIYVFDRSASMDGRPLAAAKRELIDSLHSLHSANQFQVIFYNQEPHLMPALRGARQALIPADEPGKRLAANFIGSIFADGPTNHMAALQVALELHPDVIFFLTDAEEPQLGTDDFLRIGQLNRGTAIHAIEFVAGPPRSGPNFLQRLALENGGEHTYIDVTRLPALLR
jgi:hypothetical protein